MITAIISKLLSCISFIKKYFNLIAVTIIAILTAFLFYWGNKLKLANNEIDRILNNYEYYLNKSTGIEELNRVLLLTIDDFKETKDSLIQELRATLKKLGIKEKKLNQLQTLKLEVIHDTTVVVKSPDFTLEIKPNSLTSIIINKKDSILTHCLKIENVQTLFITQERVYRRKYKNWFIRLLHFDFKKKTQLDYQIDNSNNLIITKDTRLIEIVK